LSYNKHYQPWRKERRRGAKQAQNTDEDDDFLDASLLAESGGWRNSRTGCRKEKRQPQVSLSRRRLKTNPWTPPQHFSYRVSVLTEMREKKDNKKKKRKEESRRC
jgi:hypothetical protein